MAPAPKKRKPDPQIFRDKVLNGAKSVGEMTQYTHSTKPGCIIYEEH
jgi:hypothetical protein